MLEKSKNVVKYVYYLTYSQNYKHAGVSDAYSLHSTHVHDASYENKQDVVEGLF